MSMWLVKAMHQFVLHRTSMASGISAILLYLLWLMRSSTIVAEGSLLNAFRQRVQFIYAGWRLKDMLRPMVSADETPFHRRMKSRPSLLGAVIRPYQSTNWDSRTRLSKLGAHYDSMARLRWLFDPEHDPEVTLCTLSMIHPELRFVMDEAIWFKNEGPLVVSLFLKTDRIFSIAFAVREENGDLIAHVGAIQGRNPRDIPDILDVYRDLTRSAHGLRTRDLLIELFRMFCAHLGVARIFLVSDRYQQHRDPYFGSSRGEVLACYNGVWEERGAVRIDDTMFELPLQAVLRDTERIPPRKRALYRRRYDMLAEISGIIAARLDRQAS